MKICYILFCILLISRSLKGQTEIYVKDIIDPSRVIEGRYQLIQYNRSADILFNVSILDRQIFREIYNGKRVIRIKETNSQVGSIVKTLVLFIDIKTLLPLSVANYSNDTLVQQASFSNDKIQISDFKNGNEIKSEAVVGPNIYSSSSMAEVLESTDFSKHRLIKFSTVTPGRPVNEFIIERVGEKKLKTESGKEIDCWVLKFTRIDAKGNKISVGSRCIDKQTGKALTFKIPIDPDKTFSYQALVLD